MSTIAIERRDAANPAATQIPTESAALRYPLAEAAAQILERHPDFRIMRRPTADAECPLYPDANYQRAVIVSTTTIEVEPGVQHIIELAMLVLQFSAAPSVLGAVIESYEGFEDPGCSISEESMLVHGICNEVLARQQLNERRIEYLLEDVTLVIAHHAQLHRAALEARVPEFASLPWLCTSSQIPWTDYGFRNAKLDHLLFTQRLFNDSPRALAQCRAILALLRRPLPGSATTAFTALMNTAAQPRYELCVLNAPFSANEHLKIRGYQWNTRRDVWHRTLAQESIQGETQWLKAHVYSSAAGTLEIETLDAHTNFSERRGRTSTLQL